MAEITFKKPDPNQPLSFAQALGSPIVGNSMRKLKIVTPEEAIEESVPFRVLESGPPSGGKTHFALTFAPPIKVIDTENRYKLILPKFRTCKDCNHSFVSSDINPKTSKKNGIKTCPKCNSTNIKIKDIAGIHCNTGSEVIEAAQIFTKQLEEHFVKTGEYGTLIVDNVSKKWDWDQNEYATKKYGHALETDSERLDPRGDYKFINPEHNEKFRDKILTANCHVVMIATLKENYDKNDAYKVIGSRSDGQKHNPFAVDWDIIVEQGKIPLSDGTFVLNGQFTSYIKKNSLISTQLNSFQDLNYDKLVTLRKRLLVECGVTEEEIIPPKEEEKK